MNNFINYAKHVAADKYILNWINTVAKKENDKKKLSTEEVEHIIDYLVQANKKVSKMSYKQARELTNKWNKSLIKKGSQIKESKKDIELIHDFKDGFKIVKLVGKNAYKREGSLMRHCVASYYGKDVEIYSLRDKNNMPHCTMEKNQQIKGKGNGDIHPKYIGYVVKFLEKTGMNVGDNEMKHLGYVNIKKILTDVDKKTIKKELFNGVYFPKHRKELLKDKNGNELNNLDMLSIFPLIEEENKSLKISFDIPLLVSGSIEWIKNKISNDKKTNNNIEIGGYRAQLAGGDRAQLAGGDRAQLAGGYGAQLVGGYRAQLAGGDEAQLAGGYGAQLAGGDGAQLAGGYGSRLTVGRGGVAVGDDGSVARGKIGACIVLCERDDDNNLINVKASIVDGKKIKEDTWYTLKGVKLVEQGTT